MRRPITYIVPVYNYGHFLPEAVASICSGNLQSADEILIVNDASTDNTADVMRVLAQENAQIRLLAHRHNKGCSTAGYNTAIEAAKNGLFYGLAADNLLAANSIDQLVQFMIQRKADVAAFQEVRFFTTDTNKPTHSWFFNSECTLADALSGHEWPGSSGHYLFTRESWLKAGRCDEFFGGLDSWAFGIRQLATGSRMVTLEGSHYLHRWGHESLWCREATKGELSLKAMRVLLPILNLLEEESVEYLFSPIGRTTWFENLKGYPLRVRDQDLGKVGTIVRHHVEKDPLFKRLRRYLAGKLAPVH